MTPLTPEKFFQLEIPDNNSEAESEAYLIRLVNDLLISDLDSIFEYAASLLISRDKRVTSPSSNFFINVALAVSDAKNNKPTSNSPLYLKPYNLAKKIIQQGQNKDAV